MRALASLVAVVAVLVASCSSGLTIEEYVPAMESATDAYVTESQNLSYDYQSGVEDGVRGIVASGGDTIEADAHALVLERTTQYLALLGDAMERYAASIDDIAPPAALGEPHTSFLAAITAVHASLPETRSAVLATEHLDEVQYALGSSGFSDGQIRWTATCRALEQAVRDEGVGLNLRCTVEKSR